MQDDPTNPWVKDLSTKQSNVSTLLDWPEESDESDTDVTSPSKLFSSLNSGGGSGGGGGGRSTVVGTSRGGDGSVWLEEDLSNSTSNVSSYIGLHCRSFHCVSMVQKI